MKCPDCGGECERDEVDNGIGMDACGPWGCPECHWVEPQPKWREPQTSEAQGE